MSSTTENGWLLVKYFEVCFFARFAFFCFFIQHQMKVWWRATKRLSMSRACCCCCCHCCGCCCRCLGSAWRRRSCAHAHGNVLSWFRHLTAAVFVRGMTTFVVDGDELVLLLLLPGDIVGRRQRIHGSGPSISACGIAWHTWE